MSVLRYSPRRQSAKDKNKVDSFKWRFSLVIFVLFPAFVVGTISQMYRWQVIGHEKFETMAEQQLIEDKRLPSSRGTIYASDGSILALDEPVWGVYASISTDEEERERFNKQRESFIQIVTQILDVDAEELDKKLDEDFRYVLIKNYISSEKKKELEEKKKELEEEQTENKSEAQKVANEMEKSGTDEDTINKYLAVQYEEIEMVGLFGLHFEREEKRIYPDGRLASHILGFVGKSEEGEDVGQYGLEGYYAGDLLGKEGFKYEEKDSRGNVIMTGEYDPVLPRQGKNIVLTIRPNIQATVEKYLEKGVKKHEAKSGSAIVLDPNTGEIIAMANYPDYDPNLYFNEEDATVFKNKAISDVYEYGSVNKVLTVSMALEEGKITPNTICNDDKGYIEILDKKIYTWDKMPDGSQRPKDVLKNSNNVCAAKFGLKVGIDRNYEYLKKFGIGDFLGIGLQDEATSYLKPLGYWNELDLATSAFGQTISATPLQVVSAVSTIANDGKRMRPFIVKELYDEEESIEIKQEVASSPISVDTARKVQDMMRAVVTGGEAHGWFDKEVPNYSIAGKTGTAQIPYPDKVGYYKDRTNATFVGFSPVHGAKMIMIVRLEEPGTNQYAASTAVPVWIDIYKNVAMELGIAPEGS